MNSELRLNHNRTGSNKHGKSAKDISFTDLVKLLDMTETASGSNVQSKQSTCYRKLRQQNRAWHESTKCIEQKFLTDHEPKWHRRYNGAHVNIASFINSFRLSRKLEHGKTDIKQACLRARCTYHKALHNKLSIHPASRHGIEARHGKKHSRINYNNIGKKA